MTVALVGLFWILFAAIAWVYLGFPLLILFKSLWRKPYRKEDVTPHVSLVIIAYNESAAIGEKLDNILALDYPREKLEIIVGSDGSNDGTDEIVAGYADRGIRLCSFPRRGKIPALNDAVSLATGEILAFSDANSMFSRDALRILVRPFADPTIGGVAGNQCYTTSTGNAASHGEKKYWSFDRILKRLESESGHTISSTGAIHAVRREFFAPVPSGVCDDSVISKRVILGGSRLVFEPDAIASEPVAPSDGAELARKMRVITRGLSALWEVRELFNPFQFGFYSFQLFSHKLLRWAAVWLLLGIFFANAMILGQGLFYQVFFAAQVLFYVSAIAGCLLRNSSLRRAKAFKLLAIPYYFCFANYAALRAWIKLMQGTRWDIWDSKRSSVAGPMAPKVPS
ncbi:MAG: glycosyltransferase family 2 protein [Planctomycetaceae bacterium]